jgi:hypothetical protein
MYHYSKKTFYICLITFKNKHIMKKVLLTAAAVLSLTFVNAQSNQKGTKHVNIMGGFLSGSSTFQADAAGSKEVKFSAAGAQFGANFQYGLAESFSAGIGLEIGTAVLTPKDVDYTNGNYDFFETDLTSTISALKVNLSGRYYILNKDKVNIYAGPSVGYTSGKSVLDIFEPETKYTGLNYGVNAGANFYFSDVVGIIVNLGYEGNNLKTKTIEDGKEYTGKATLSGIKAMVGLALKF